MQYNDFESFDLSFVGGKIITSEPPQVPLVKFTSWNSKFFNNRSIFGSTKEEKFKAKQIFFGYISNGMLFVVHKWVDT